MLNNTVTVLSSRAIITFAFSLGPNAHAAEAIKVGVVTPLSGSYAPIGKQVRWGAELAVKEINAAGGVGGRPFELLFEDEEANPPVASPKNCSSKTRSIFSLEPSTAGQRSRSARLQNETIVFWLRPCPMRRRSRARNAIRTSFA